MSSIDRAYDEKRNFIRMQINTPAQVSLESNGENFSGVCKDLSGGGMLVELEKAVPVGDEVEVTISSPHGHSPMLKALTKVTRVSGGPGEKYTVGLEIVAMRE